MANHTGRGKPRGGRPPKGGDTKRSPIISRLPESHKASYEAIAREINIPISDYVALIMAQHHNVEIPKYLRAAAEQLVAYQQGVQAQGEIDYSAA